MATPDSRYTVNLCQNGEHKGKYLLIRRYPSGKSVMAGVYENKERALHAARTLNSEGGN